MPSHEVTIMSATSLVVRVYPGSMDYYEMGTYIGEVESESTRWTRTYESVPTVCHILFDYALRNVKEV